MEKKLSHFSLIIPVKNMTETLAWYREQLGFELTFSWEDPISYAVVGRDDLRIHFSLSDDEASTIALNTSLYIFCHDLDSIFEECKSKGLVKGDLPTRDYGMRDFDITDLNGFRITFGKSVE